MTEDQILEIFLGKYAPHAERRRRSPNNHLLQVHRTIEQVFLYFSNTRVSLDGLRKALLNLGFDYSYGSILAIGSRSSDEHFFINPESVESLRRVVKALPENTKECVWQENEELKRSLNEFFHSVERSRNDLINK